MTASLMPPGSALLRTRVDIRNEAQSQDLLRSLTRGQRLQDGRQGLAESGPQLRDGVDGLPRRKPGTVGLPGRAALPLPHAAGQPRHL